MTTTSQGATPATPAEASGFSAARIRLGRAFQGASKDALLLTGTTLFLVVLGLVMVFSSSLVESRSEDGGMLAQVGKQATYALIGVPLMLLASRIPERFWMRVSWLALGGSMLLQLLVVATPLGVTRGGNTNWILLGPVQFQPSELLKVSLVIWLGMMATKKQHKLDQFREGVLPIVLVAGAAIGLVLVGGDLGTTMVMGLTLLGALFLIGVPLRVLALPVFGAGVAVALAALTSGNRMRRIAAFLSDNCGKAGDALNEGACWQIQHGTFALANGGVFGVGLGNSAAKWSWLPEADNDFIFAIVGEELGLIGAVVVIGLFVMLAFAFARILRHARTPFAAAATATVMVWVLAQACINIGVVLGVFPVLGVPLPLVSAGGTALVTTLFAIGIVLSVARDPVAAERTAARAAARRSARTERVTR